MAWEARLSVRKGTSLISRRYVWHKIAMQPVDVCRTPRLAAAVTMYRLQNAAVALSAFSAFVTSFLSPGHFFYWAFVLVTISTGAVSSVGCQGSSLSVEREWTKALCQGDSASLASLNAGAIQCNPRTAAWGSHSPGHCSGMFLAGIQLCTLPPAHRLLMS